MADNKDMKQQETNLAATSPGASRKPASKAAGTRAGTLLDWRGDSVKSGKAPRRRLNSLRDGR